MTEAERAWVEYGAALQKYKEVQTSIATDAFVKSVLGRQQWGKAFRRLRRKRKAEVMDAVHECLAARRRAVALRERRSHD